MGVSPMSLMLFVVEKMALGIPTDGGCSLDHLAGVGVYTPAFPTLSVQRHLALQRDEETMKDMIMATAFLPQLYPHISRATESATGRYHPVVELVK